MERCLLFTFQVVVGACLLAMVSGCGLTLHSTRVDSEVRARLDLATSYLSNGQPRLSLRELLAVQDQAASNPDFHYLFGMTAMEMHDPQKARPHFERAVTLRPDFGKAWNHLGQTYVQLNLPAKARQAFEKALSIPTYTRPEYPAYNLARLLQSQGRTEKALHMARKSLKYNPGFAPAALMVATSMTAGGRVDAAEKILRQGVQADPGNTRLMLALAENLLRLGRQEQAKQWFEKIVRNHPHSDPAQVARDYLELLTVQ